MRPIDHEPAPLVQQMEPWPADAPRIHLDVRGISKSFEQRGSGLFGQRKGPTFRAVDDVSFSIPRGECFGLVGESGCGKTTLSKVIMRALEPDSGQVLFNDRGTMVDVVQADPRSADALPPARPVHLPGPVRLLQPADDGVRHPARAARDPRGRRRRLPGRDGEGADAARRARPALPQSLSAQLFRRPAPAHRHRPRARAEARSRAVRRARVGARRLDPGADPEPPQGPAGRARPHLPLHLAQSRRGRLHRRRNRGHVPRPHRRDRAARGAVQESAAPLHARPPRRRAVRGPQAQARSRRGAGRGRAAPAGVARAVRVDAESAGELVDVGDGHRVRMQPGGQQERLSA